MARRVTTERDKQYTTCVGVVVIVRCVDDVTVEVQTRSPRWFARNVRHVCDGAVRRSGRYCDTVRSETTIPSFSNSPWIRGAPQRWFSVAIRRMRARICESIHGLPGRRRGRRLHAALHNANGRPWPAEPAPVRSSTQATTVARTARTDGPMGERVDPNERGPPAGGAVQDTQEGGLDARTGLSGAPRSSETQLASAVQWPAAARTSTIFTRTRFWRRTTACISRFGISLPELPWRSESLAVGCPTAWPRFHGRRKPSSLTTESVRFRRASACRCSDALTKTGGSGLRHFYG
jgi:hypothetical protein